MTPFLFLLDVKRTIFILNTVVIELLIVKGHRNKMTSLAKFVNHSDSPKWITTEILFLLYVEAFRVRKWWGWRFGLVRIPPHPQSKRRKQIKCKYKILYLKIVAVVLKRMFKFKVLFKTKFLYDQKSTRQGKIFLWLLTSYVVSYLY